MAGLRQPADPCNTVQVGDTHEKGRDQHHHDEPADELVDLAAEHQRRAAGHHGEQRDGEGHGAGDVVAQRGQGRVPRQAAASGGGVRQVRVARHDPEGRAADDRLPVVTHEDTNCPHRITPRWRVDTSRQPRR